MTSLLQYNFMYCIIYHWSYLIPNNYFYKKAMDNPSTEEISTLITGEAHKELFDVSNLSNISLNLRGTSLITSGAIDTTTTTEELQDRDLFYLLKEWNLERVYSDFVCK